ncbi:MAG: hypothetical protein NVS3B1_10100 [Marmoricola sp.]
MLILAGPFLALSAFEAVRIYRSDGLSTEATVLMVALMFLLAVAALSILTVWLRRRNMSVFVREDTIGMTDTLGRRTTAPLADLECVRLSSRTRRLVTGASLPPEAITQFVSTKSDGNLFEYRGTQISLSDLQRLGTATGVPLLGSWPDH